LEWGRVWSTWSLEYLELKEKEYNFRGKSLEYLEFGVPRVKRIMV